jgi:hypothetical protein
MSNILIQEVPQVMVGLGTMTFTVINPGIYNVKYVGTIPSAVPTDSGAGSGKGLGAGTGGGAGYNGFSGGGQGQGAGAVGQGFGATPGYQQPPASGSNVVPGPSVSSSLSIVVKQNGTTRYTAPVPSPTQGQVEFKYTLNCAASDVIAVVLSSSNVNDEYLNTVKSTVSIGTGI